MGLKELFLEENEQIWERYSLSLERIRQIPREETVPEDFRAYFHQLAAYILQMDELNVYGKQTSNEADQKDDDLSVDDPDDLPGSEYDDLLGWLRVEIRKISVFALQNRRMDMVIRMELFIEIYNAFEDELLPETKSLRQMIYWYISDYCDRDIEIEVLQRYDVTYDGYRDVILGMDFNMSGISAEDSQTVLIQYQKGTECFVQRVAASVSLGHLVPVLQCTDAYGSCEWSMDADLAAVKFWDKALYERKLSALKKSCDVHKSLIQKNRNRMCIFLSQGNTSVRGASKHFDLSEKQSRLWMMYQEEKKRLLG